MAIILVGSVAIQKPLLVSMGEKQGTFTQIRPEARPIIHKNLKGMTARLGLFFLAHSALATWAAFYWSTRAWALLKGVGFTGSMIVYLVIETLFLRRRIQQAIPRVPSSEP
jgi:intracellular septation protein A